MLIHNVHANSKNAGLLLVPVWARKRSQLYHNQDTMLRSLGLNTCDFSQQASLLFNKKVDVREPRPQLPGPHHQRFPGQRVGCSLEEHWAGPEYLHGICGAAGHPKFLLGT